MTEQTPPGPEQTPGAPPPPAEPSYALGSGGATSPVPGPLATQVFMPQRQGPAAQPSQFGAPPPPPGPDYPPPPDAPPGYPPPPPPGYGPPPQGYAPPPPGYGPPPQGYPPPSQGYGAPQPGYPPPPAPGQYPAPPPGYPGQPGMGMSPYAQPGMGPMAGGTPFKMRKPIGVWFLALITLGIYQYVWLYKISGELKNSGAPRTENLQTLVLLGLITFGITTLVAAWRIGNRVGELQVTRGQPRTSSGARAVLLSMITFGLAYPFIVQGSINRLSQPPRSS